MKSLRNILFRSCLLFDIMLSDVVLTFQILTKVIHCDLSDEAFEKYFRSLLFIVRNHAEQCGSNSLRF